MFKNEIRVGTITGTGAAIDVELGFLPDHVKIISETDNITLEWVPTMGAGKGHKTIAAGTKSFIATGGISQFAGSTSKAAGFTLGTDAINTAAKALHYIAERMN